MYRPYTPQQNGAADQKNRHLLDVTRTLLIESSVPPRFLAKGLTTTVHLINHLPAPTIAQLTPHFKLFGHHPLFDHLHTFGCVCFVHLPPTERTKLIAQSRRFLGYATNQKGFVCYEPIGHRIRVSRNVIFFENQYFFQTHLDCPHPSSPAILPGLSDKTTVSRFHPDFFYHHREKPTTVDARPPDPPPTPGSTTPHILCRSSRTSRPPERYEIHPHFIDDNPFFCLYPKFLFAGNTT